MSKYNYYDYLKKYDAGFLNKYESWGHANWSRRSNFLQLLYFRATTLMTGRIHIMHGIKLKGWYYTLSVLVCLADIYGIWFYQEIYNKYAYWKWVYYQPYFKNECEFFEYITKYITLVI